MNVTDPTPRAERAALAAQIVASLLVASEVKPHETERVRRLVAQSVEIAAEIQAATKASFGPGSTNRHDAIEAVAAGLEALCVEDVIEALKEARSDADLDLIVDALDERQADGRPLIDKIKDIFAEQDRAERDKLK